jgi:hypothetical protein
MSRRNRPATTKRDNEYSLNASVLYVTLIGENEEDRKGAVFQS